MATPAQVIANRENSKLSTGPRTPEGKAASSHNAATHGFSAADPVLSYEDRNQFNCLLQRYQSDFAPTTAHEQFLLYKMAVARDTPPPQQPLGPTASKKNPPGTGPPRLERYRASLERTYHRCARELRATRKEQKEANSTELAEKKFEELLKRMLDAPPPGHQFQPHLVRADQKTQHTSNSGENHAANSASTARSNGS